MDELDGTGVALNPPTFFSNQVLSASFHMNGLQRYAHGLRDAFAGYQLPYMGSMSRYEATNDSQLYRAAIRHKVNTLEYNLSVLSNGNPVYLFINEDTVATFYGGHYQGSVDLSPFNMAYNAFYTLSLRGPALGYTYTVRKMRETAVLVYPTLVSFDNGTRPTYQHWQALPNYATKVAQALSAPVALVPEALENNPGNYPANKEIFFARIPHRCRYLAYSLHQRAPYHQSDDGSLPWISTRFYINGSSVFHRRNGKATTPDAGIDFAQSSAQERVWTGLLDLDTYAPSLRQGDEYEFVVYSQDGTTFDFDNLVRLIYVYEAPAIDQAAAGWSNFTQWQHGDYVVGSGSAPAVQDLKNALILLGNKLPVYVNAASHSPLWNISGKGHFGVRRRRFLHYRNEAGRQVSITWRYQNNNEYTAGLADASERWMAIDLDTLTNLWPGVRYTIKGALYAIEDEYS